MNRAVDLLRKILLCTLVVAWPWEVFQQLPFADLTLVKTCGGALIGLAVIDMVLKGRWTVPRTGLEWPLAALMLVCLVSVYDSADREASWSLIARYGMYIVSAYAIAWAVTSYKDATVAARLFFLSATFVALIAILCSFGVMAPLFAEFAKQVGRRVAWDTESGSLVRMAATAPDFNQGVLTFLLALPVALWLPNRRPVHTVLKWSAVALLLGGMLVAFSRSAIAISAVLLIACALWSMKEGRFSRRNILLVTLVAVLVIIAAMPYALSLGGRINRGIEGNEASVAHRMYVYRLAVDLLPEYWIGGTGINASDPVIEAIADPEKTGGQTLHSVPFKFLLETGVLGLAAYLWLWTQAFVLLWRGHRRAPDDDARRFHLILLAAAFALFVMTIVQPFTHLSIYPILLGLAFGPRSEEKPIRRNTYIAPMATAAAAALVIVTPNVYDYQMLAREMATYARDMEAGHEAESRGDWSTATAFYSRAQQDLVTREPSHRYFPYAADVTGLEMLYENVGVARINPDPSAAAAFTFGRATLVEPGGPPSTTALTEALRIEPDYAAAEFLLAEAFWHRRQFANALRHYGNAAEKAALPDNAPYATTLAPVSLDANEHEDAESLVFLADRFRRLGDWESCIEACNAALAIDPQRAHALYLKGVDAEMNGDMSEAERLYREGLEIDSEHFDSDTNRGFR